MDLAFLQPLYEHPGPWASVYVDTSQRSESMAHERSLMALDMFRQLAAQDADEPTCRAVYTAIEELRHASEPYGRALFATHGQIVLDPPLSRPPQRTAAWWAPLPHTAPLLELADPEPVCLVAYIDRRGAEFELRGALGSEAAGAVTGRQWPIHKTATRDWSERHFQLKVENTWEHNAAEVADAITVCQEETRADLIVLVGDDRERRSVHNRLPKRLHDRTAESTHGVGSRLLDEEVERIRAGHVRRRAEEDLERFLAARAPDGGGPAGAVEGVPALVAAAREHRIDELLIRLEAPDADREIWIGERPDQLAVRRTDLTGPGLDAPPIPARADDALLRCAVATGAPAISVSSLSPEEVPVGGLGALLRWT